MVHITQETPGSKVTDHAKPAGAQEISVVEILKLVLQKKRLILLNGLGGAVLAGIVAFLWPPSFKAQSTILPPQAQSSISLLSASGLNGLAATGMASQLGLKNPADIYVSMLSSRTVEDNLIKRFQLQKVYGTRYASETRDALEKHASLTSGKDSMIKIAVEDHDPVRAAAIANAYVEELYSLNSRIATTDAGQRRLFLEREVEKETKELADAETALKQTQERTGLVVPAGQAEALIRSQAELRAEIASREVQLAAVGSYATEDNPQVQVLRREIAALRNNLSQVEAKSGTTGGAPASSSSLPEAALESMRRLRNVRYHESLYELLSKQYVAARIEEAKQGPVIQVVDNAVVPDKKSWPPRALFVAAGVIAGVALSAFWVLFRGSLKNAQAAAAFSTQIQALDGALKG